MELSVAVSGAHRKETLRKRLSERFLQRKECKEEEKQESVNSEVRARQDKVR